MGAFYLQFLLNSYYEAFPIRSLILRLFFVNAFRRIVDNLYYLNRSYLHKVRFYLL